MLLEERKAAVDFLVATFGKGRLVQTAGGRYELRGGTLIDLLEAREWASLFIPEAIVRPPAEKPRRCS